MADGGASGLELRSVISTGNYEVAVADKHSKTTPLHCNSGAAHSRVFDLIVSAPSHERTRRGKRKYQEKIHCLNL